MNALQETTVWEGKAQPNHIYLIDSDRMVAFIRSGETVPFYFKKPIQISVRGRTFKPVVPSPFRMVKANDTIEVTGSKGQTYFVNTIEKTCTCPGYIYRGDCKHIKDL
jgi:hypothetical protein